MSFFKIQITLMVCLTSKVKTCRFPTSNRNFLIQLYQATIVRYKPQIDLNIYIVRGYCICFYLNPVQCLLIRF